MAIGLVLCSISVVASLVLGGGTRSGFVGDLVLQLVTIPPLLYACWRLAGVPSGRRPAWVWIVPLAVLLVPLLQIVPLPSGVWRGLPNRQMVAEVLDLAGSPNAVQPLSVAPSESWRAALSLLPPLAIFLGVVTLNHAERRRLSLIVVFAGIASAILGLLQVGQGPASPLRLFAFTSSDDAVGFFANRNHFAAFIYCITLLLGAWFTFVVTVLAPARRRRYKETNWVLAVLAASTAFAALIATEAMTRSRAGIALMVVAIVAVLAMSLSARREGVREGSLRWPIAAALLGLALIGQYALYGTVERFTGSDPLKDGRIAIARTTIDAARSFMPLGSGLGTFTSIYPAFEKVEDAMRDTFVNRAHNDILESWLETGVVGPAMIAAFTIWLLVRAVSVWRRSPSPDRHPVDQLLAQAAAIALGLLLAHSFLDYPLRTAAMMGLGAFLTAILVQPVLMADDDERYALPVAAAGRRSRPLTPVKLPEAEEVESAEPPLSLTRSRPDVHHDDRQPGAMPMTAAEAYHRVATERDAHSLAAVAATSTPDWPELPAGPQDVAVAEAAPPKPPKPSAADPTAWPEDWLKPANNPLPSTFRKTRDRSGQNPPDDEESKG